MITALTAFTALTETEALILAEMQEDQNAFDLQPARVKIAPGGIGQFLLEDELAKSFTAVVAISQKIRGYWPETGTGNPPLCSSPDGNLGYFDFDAAPERLQSATHAKKPHPAIVLLDNGESLPESFRCVRCPMNEWGSEHQRRNGTGRGRACKEMRRLLLLIDGWALPALMSLPPTSIRTWDSYCSGLAAKKGAYFAVKTRFELDSAKAIGGETYNTVQVSVAGKIEDMAMLQAVSEIRQRYRSLVSNLPVDAVEYDTRPISEEDEVPF